MKTLNNYKHTLWYMSDHLWQRKCYKLIKFISFSSWSNRRIHILMIRVNSASSTSFWPIELSESKVFHDWYIRPSRWFFTYYSPVLLKCYVKDGSYIIWKWLDSWMTAWSTNLTNSYWAMIGTKGKTLLF